MAFVINHHEMGVYLGSCMGLGFWSKLDPVDDTAATFDTEDEANSFMDSWTEGRSEGVELVPVQVKSGQKASISECVDAGLDAWVFKFENLF